MDDDLELNDLKAIIFWAQISEIHGMVVNPVAFGKIKKRYDKLLEEQDSEYMKSNNKYL